MKKRYLIILAIPLSIWLYMELHRTPELAIRTSIFFSGHPIVAFQGKVEKMYDVNGELLQSRTGDIYYSIPIFEAHGTGIVVASASVKKDRNLYKVKYGNP
ncbi:hypothetical protein QUF99_16975 [Bacillus sp. DX4.1]|uniref:hypothetical protein n=1 Tax=Bacillus sp. DX4.1 TaxID=3055867 RepID=UPI0025A06121|nr:hypothetical protein [Bacillus sp. DX4.1]MDM5188949.1 hypothetical protein [Bacillus sp. DX4.1]